MGLEMGVGFIVLSVVVIYSVALMVRCLVNIHQLGRIMERNEEVGERIEASRNMDVYAALEEHEKIKREQEQLEKELDRFTKRQMLTLGLWP